MKPDDGQIEKMLKEAFDAEIAEHTQEPFTGHIPTLESSSLWALNLGRFAAAAGFAGLFWTASVFQGPRPLDAAINQAMENRPTIEEVVTMTAAFVSIALTSE